MIRRLSIAFALVTFAWVSPAFADNTTAPNARELFLGQAQSQFFAAAQDRWYKANLVAGRSYVLLVWAPYTDPSQALVSLDSQFFLNDGTTVATTQYSGDVEPRMELSNNGDQTKIIPSTSGTHRISVSNVAAAGYNVHVMLVESTLFSPWFFAAGGYDGFITIRNNTTSTLTVVITTYSPAGAVLGTDSVNIPANGNTFVTASSLGGAGTSGSAQIAHNGSLNAISANITTLSGGTGLSFDAPFTPRMSWGMTIAF